MTPSKPHSSNPFIRPELSDITTTQAIAPIPQSLAPPLHRPQVTASTPTGQYILPPIPKLTPVRRREVQCPWQRSATTVRVNEDGIYCPKPITGSVAREIVMFTRRTYQTPEPFLPVTPRPIPDALELKLLKISREHCQNFRRSEEVKIQATSPVVETHACAIY